MNGERPSTSPRSGFFLGAMLLFGAGVAAGLALHEGLWLRAEAPPPEMPKLSAPTPSPKKPTPPKEADKPNKPDWQIGVEATIEPTPDGLYWATPRLSGREVRFLVQPGQRVRQDTPLLVQDHPGANSKELAEQDQREALLNLTIAKRRCELAEREWQRANEAKLAESVLDRLRVELQVAKDRCQAAQELVKKAELNKELAEFERNLKIVESPFAGIVLKVEGSRGQTSPNGVGVCVLNPSVVLAPCVVPAANVKAFSERTTVQFSPVGQSPKWQPAKVTGVTPRLLSGNKFDEHSWHVWVEIRNPEGLESLFPGQRVLLRFPEIVPE